MGRRQCSNSKTKESGTADVVKPKGPRRQPKQLGNNEPKWCAFGACCSHGATYSSIPCVNLFNSFLERDICVVTKTKERENAGECHHSAF